MKYRKLIAMLIFFSASLFFTCGVSAKENPLTGFTEVARYIKERHALPQNFITKEDAKNLIIEGEI